ncbi:LamG domain-containing protein [Patescibacteria group bacterium]|nr:MAG: LamG domain-containing protein [Patescibacteria group bacterium]
MTKKFYILTIVFLAFLGAVFFASSSAHAAAPRTGLVGYWSLDSNDINGTKVYDKSGQQNHGTSANTPTKVAGKVGGAMSFNGASDKVSATSSLYNFGTGNFSLSTWVKINALGNNYVFIDKYNSNSDGERGFFLMKYGTSPNDTMCFAIDSGGCSLNGTIPLKVNTWYHVAAVRNGANAYVYINGVQDGTVGGQATKNASSNSNLNIGTYNNGTSVTNGSIDDVRIYNRALSAAEVKQLYNSAKTSYTNTAPRGTVAKQLVGYWTMDSNDINSTTVYDKSGQNNHGASVNTPTKVAGKVGGAMSFNGTTDYVTSTLQSSSIMTISYWGKMNNLDSGSNFGMLFYNTSAETSGTLGVMVLYGGGLGIARNYVAYQKYGQVAPIANDNKWHLFTFVVNKSDYTQSHIYLDGVEISYSTQQNTSFASDAGFYINRLKVGGDDRREPGLMDDVRVYNYALSAAEVKKLYNSAKKTYTTAAPRTGLVGYWSMDSNDINGTTVYDKSGQQNHGTSANTPTKVAGKVGGAMSFNGTSDYVEATDKASLHLGVGNFTLSAWIKTADTAAAIVDKYGAGGGGGQYNFSIVSGKLDGFTWNATMGVRPVGIATVSDNKWHHVVFVVDSDGTSARFYIDGAQDGSITGATAKNSDSSGTLRIGNNSNSSVLLNGFLDDARIYNRALSAAEVKQLYNAAKKQYK